MPQRSYLNMNNKSWLANVSILFLVVVGNGCSDSVSQPETDDAKKRAIVEGVTTVQAAQRYSYRTVKDVPHVPDFFAGMDTISEPFEEDAIPDPLLDTIAATQQASSEETAAPPAEKDVAEKDDPVLRPKANIQSPKLNVNERIGRNTWMVWCAGNEGFWDWLATDSLGFIDFLKLIDSRNRDLRFSDTGLINEPGMEQGRTARKEEHGLWLDRPADPLVRKWRKAYIDQTFKAIGEGRHKSQVGLRKKGISGKFDGPLLITQDTDATAFKDEGYRYPSSYMESEGYSNESPYAAAPAGYGAAGDDLSEGKVAYQASGEFSELDEQVPPPDLYGLSSGVIGLRLFPNPYFDNEAQQRWDVDRFYNDSTYYNDPKLVRPFRVGMSCAFCHTSFHPLKPPRDLQNPQWSNLSGNIGAQYLSMRATVGSQLTPDQFVYHLLESQPRGTIDTSLVASDNLNNPNTMNAIFGLKQRAFLSLHNPQEHLSKESARQPSLWKHPDPKHPGDQSDVVPQELVDEATRLGVVDAVVQSNENPRHVPRILLDGSDSIGTWGALARVYLNIGSYWEQWNVLHQVVLGFTPQKPFLLADCEENSVYWNATTRRVPGLRDYFLKITPTMPLLSTPGGNARTRPIDVELLKQQAEREKRDVQALLASKRAMRVDIDQLEQGRKVFAHNCIVCHSSIQPESTAAYLKEYPNGEAFTRLVAKRKRLRNSAAQSGEFWEHDPGQWFEDPAYLIWAETVVEEPTFWKENFLSTDYRIPVNVVNTNSARAMGTNGMTGHMWHDFASESYRQLPSPGAIDYFNPYKGKDGGMDSFMPRHINPNTREADGGGGPGYYRVPSLMSIWATAPLLHNNSLGLYNNDPSVDGRLLAFDDAIRKLLWPEKRLQSSSYNGATASRLQEDHGLIWRTTQESYLAIDSERVPAMLHRLPGIANLHKRKGLHWLHAVQPLWLPSMILMGGGLLVLWLSRAPQRRSVGGAVLIAALLIAVVLWLANTFAASTWIGGLTCIQPWPLPAAALLLVAVVLLLPIQPRPTRWSGYLFVVFSLAVGTVVYFNAGKLGDIRLGPIPAGTPVNLLANFNSEADRGTQKESVATLVNGLAEVKSRHLDAEATQKVLKEKIAPALMQVNKCPDFVMDKGHYFPWFDGMTDDDKNALIELLKTL